MSILSVSSRSGSQISNSGGQSLTPSSIHGKVFWYDFFSATKEEVDALRFRDSFDLCHSAYHLDSSGPKYEDRAVLGDWRKKLILPEIQFPYGDMSIVFSIKTKSLLFGNQCLLSFHGRQLSFYTRFENKNVFAVSTGVDTTAGFSGVSDSYFRLTYTMNASNNTVYIFCGSDLVGAGEYPSVSGLLRGATLLADHSGMSNYIGCVESVVAYNRVLSVDNIRSLDKYFERRRKSQVGA